MKINKQNNNGKEVSIVYGDDNSINVNIFNNKILMGIVGSFDNNLKELEKVSGPKIYFRGNSIAIKGNKNYLQKYCEVLVENKLDNQGKYFGRTKYMTPVIFEADNCKIGELANIEITSFNQKNLFGIYKTTKWKRHNFSENK